MQKEIDIQNMDITDKALLFVKDMYKKKFGTLNTFDENYLIYLKLPTFKACENIHEVATDYSDRYNLDEGECEFIKGDSIKPEVHWIMRSFTQYYLTEAFKAMKVDLEDDNIKANFLGKGTPGRIAKMWVGADPEDTAELGSGRWNKEPFISFFPNDGQTDIITKEVDVISCCSHHFLPFSTLEGGRAIISYKPGKYLIGISKLQRFVNWAARRFWLQEDLTKYIGKTIQRIADTEDVYVKLEGVVHGCEKYRGANAKNGNLTTEFKGGCFLNKK